MNQTYMDGQEINDDEILDILEDLHNNSDLESSLLQATQLNDEDKEILLNDNNNMTIVEKLNSETDKLNDSIEKENEKFLNDSEESSSEEDEPIGNKEDPKKAEINSSREKINSQNEKCMNLIEESIGNSSFSSSSDESFNSAVTPKENSPVKRVEIKHYCNYFESSNDSTQKCKHQIQNNENKKSITQSICLNCEFGKELNESLDHMAFFSPDKDNSQKRNFLTELKFDSPTKIEEEEKKIEDKKEIIEDPDIINDTLNEEELEATMNKSSVTVNETVVDLNRSLSDTSFNTTFRRSLSTSISETTIMLSDSDYNNDEDEYYRSKEKKYELKRKKILESQDYSDQEKEIYLNDKLNLIKRIKSNNSLNISMHSGEKWFCPRIDPPTVSEIENTFSVNYEPYVKYYKTKDKFRMKLNLYEFDSNIQHNNIYQMDHEILNEQYSETTNGDDLVWFTPAIPLPSVKRVQKKIKRKEKLLMSQKASEIKKLNKIFSNDSKQPQEDPKIENNSQKSLESITQKSSQLITPKASSSKSSQIELSNSTNPKKLQSILVQSKNSPKPIERKRKSVRFEEKTILLNENLQDPEFAQSNEKGHFNVENISKNQSLDNITFDTSKNSIPSTPYSKKSSLDESEYEYSSSIGSNSNQTLILDETINETINQTIDTTLKASFYEYESILFPKASKYIDYLSFDTQDMSTIIEKDESVSSKDSKKDKKILNNNQDKSNNLNINEVFHLTVMSMEVHVNSRGNLIPDPDLDPIGFICYTIFQNQPITQITEQSYETHLIIYDFEKRSMATTRYLGLNTYAPLSKQIKSIIYAYKEEEIFEHFARAIHYFDPDILVGFEMQKLSWSYLLRRALRLKLNDYCSQISRLPKNKRESLLRINITKKPNQTTNADNKTVATTSANNKDNRNSTIEVAPIPLEVVIAGRVILNLWRILRSEISLNVYTFENCCFNILHERVPKYNYSTLTSWFTHRTDLYRWKTVDYYAYRSRGNLRLLNSLDIVGKTSEFARVYGIEFYHVLLRGSQYRVESMMLRIARKLNYVAFSASQKQKVSMRAPECIPLTLEPESKFYTDPVAVLDFQSLYPSVIIAYNICFTTCLGRVESIGKEGSFKFGCGSLFIPDKLIKSLDFDKDIYVAPNGVAFVKQHIRQGILPIMLEDILKTRVMVKNSMKLYKTNQNLQKIFDSRQLSLKLIANVTFGYTAANYSGRMPCVEVGDSIVRVARQTLENSIKYIQANSKLYGARVVYGDTDSLFVLFENTKKSDAFIRSYKIVDEISNMNVKPVKLKFEKIYYPCILLAKKRYLGYMFETPEQAEPTLDVKGIEIIRRDGCQVSSKILERCCKILFEFKDTEKVKDYVQKQIVKIVNGKVNLKEFIIAKEYRGRDTYDNVKSIAACQIANKSLQKDPLSEPLTGERVPYVIAYGMPGLPLYELVRSPYELIDNPDIKLNYEYYVMKQILPPLDRIMCLMNVNVYDWVKSLSFKPKVFQFSSEQNLNQGVSLAKYIFSTDCVLCGKKREMMGKGASAQRGLCQKCFSLDQSSLAKLMVKFNKSEKRLENILKICQLCTSNKNLNLNYKHDCNSLDCPNNFLYLNASQDLKKTNYIRNVIDQFF